MTDRRRIDGSIGKFFDRELMAVAREVAARRVRFFPTGPDPSATTYWTRRRRTRMRREDFESMGCRSPDDLPRALEALWSSEESHPLTALTPTLRKQAT